MLELVKTADGSNTIYNTGVGENYHSTHGALQESRHVFLNAGLKHFLSLTHPSPKGMLLNDQQISQTGAGIDVVSILEVGFGTGLNFLLSADFCISNKILLNYTGIEAYPLAVELINQTGYNHYTSPHLWQQFVTDYEASLLSPVRLNNFCNLHIAGCKLEEFKTEQHYDIVYFDAFASARQPEMWTEAAINHTVKFLKPGGIFVTYAITGNLKRMLKALGCKIEKVPGALGKREMLRATSGKFIG